MTERTTGRDRRPPVRPPGRRCPTRTSPSSRTPPRPTARCCPARAARPRRTPSTPRRTSAASATAARSSPTTTTLAAAIRRLRVHGMDGAVRPRRRQPELPHVASSKRRGCGSQLPGLGDDNARRARSPAATGRPHRADVADRPPRPRVPPVRAPVRRSRRARARLARRGVATAVHYPLAITQQPAYRDLAGCRPCPEAEAWAATCVTRPVLPRADRRRGRHRGRRARPAGRGRLTVPHPPAAAARSSPACRRSSPATTTPRPSPTWSRTPARRCGGRSTTSRSSSSTTARSDGSAAVLAALADEVPELRVVHHERNRGYGGPLLSAASRPRPRSGSSTPTATPSTTPREPAACIDAVRRRHRRRPGLEDRPRRPVVPQAHRARLPPRRAAAVPTCRVRDTDCDFRLIRRDAARSTSR